MKKIIPLVIIIFLSLVSISANSQNPQKPILSNSSIKLINKKSIDNNNKPEKQDVGVASKNTNAILKKRNTTKPNKKTNTPTIATMEKRED